MIAVAEVAELVAQYEGELILGFDRVEEAAGEVDRPAGYREGVGALFFHDRQAELVGVLLPVRFQSPEQGGRGLEARIPPARCPTSADHRLPKTRLSKLAGTHRITTSMTTKTATTKTTTAKLIPTTSLASSERGCPALTLTPSRGVRGRYSIATSRT